MFVDWNISYGKWVPRNHISLTFLITWNVLNALIWCNISSNDRMIHKSHFLFSYFTIVLRKPWVCRPERDLACHRLLLVRQHKWGENTRLTSNHLIFVLKSRRCILIETKQLAAHIVKKNLIEIEINLNKGTTMLGWYRVIYPLNIVTCGYESVFIIHSSLLIGKNHYYKNGQKDFPLFLNKPKHIHTVWYHCVAEIIQNCCHQFNHKYVVETIEIVAFKKINKI